jgi:hypothetical protein
MIFLNSFMLETFKGKKDGGYVRDGKRGISRGQRGNSFGGESGTGGGGYKREGRDDSSGDFGRGSMEQVKKPMEQEKIPIEQKIVNNNFRSNRI